MLYLTKKMEKESKKDPFDGEYMGNIWGWKFSLFGLALIVFLSGIALYRHYALDAPFTIDDPSEEPQNPYLKKDTIQQKAIKND